MLVDGVVDPATDRRAPPSRWHSVVVSPRRRRRLLIQGGGGEDLSDAPEHAGVLQEEGRRRDPKKKNTDASSTTLCTRISPCTACTDTDRSEIVECATTGRIETYRCKKKKKTTNAPLDDEDSHNTNDDAAWNTVVDETGREEEPLWSISYRSCVRTTNEQEFMFIQFQVLCGFIGCISIYSIRKQRMNVASLFDQRRMNAHPNKNTRRVPGLTNIMMMNHTSNNNDGSIEMMNSRSTNPPMILRQSSSVQGSNHNNEEMKSLLSSSSLSNPMNVV
jgi:hypothetical protein